MAFNRPETTTKIYKDWQTIVRKFFRFKCCICGLKSAITHHLDGWNWAYTSRYDPKNGVIVCKKHHNEFHKIYGRGNNTRYQFDCYLRLYHNKKLEDLF
jgi:hypothetical protein